MLKWIRVRQNASATTPKSTAPMSSVLHEETKSDGTTSETEVKIEEEEDSGMEREDSVCNVELSDLKKVRFYEVNYIYLSFFLTHFLF